jgi:hypothetical protein
METSTKIGNAFLMISSLTAAAHDGPVPSMDDTHRSCFRGLITGDNFLKAPSGPNRSPTISNRPNEARLDPSTSYPAAMASKPSADPPQSGCHGPPYWSHHVIGILEPVDDRRNGARA